MNAPTPILFYQQRQQDLTAELQQLLARRKRLAWFRFFSIVGAFVAAWALWPYGWLFGILGLIALLALFVFFLYSDIDNNQSIRNQERLLGINQQELAFLDHQFSFAPDGSRFQSFTHAYTHDLDIFGRASIYQFINRTQSEQGNTCFANWLQVPADTSTILARQLAARELAPLSHWRQQLQSYGLANPLTISTEEKIATWMQEPNRFLHRTHWTILRILLPVSGIGCLALFVTEFISFQVFLPALLLLMIANGFISKLVSPFHAVLSRIAPQLSGLSNSLSWIEKASFNTPYLLAIKDKLSSSNDTASKSIRSLTRILERLDYRLNIVVFVALNTLLAWDLQQVMALEQWKEKRKSLLQNWFQALGEMEAISNIANLHFNHPQWVFPTFKKEPGFFVAENLGHPLLHPSKCVANSFATSGTGQLNLITGSNMAGKSTFLRCIGVNIVLAMAGAPVCATRFELYPTKVMSSMRISDNLEENTSTFYAELKKLKEIIDAVNRKEDVFLLLDEILRGTNSADRHTGSSALIKQLIAQKAVGVMATHDLELARLSATYEQQLHNYHFDVQVSGEELYFDYRLKEGICKSMNASILMKKIGINL